MNRDGAVGTVVLEGSSKPATLQTQGCGTPLAALDITSKKDALKRALCDQGCWVSAACLGASMSWISGTCSSAAKALSFFRSATRVA